MVLERIKKEWDKKIKINFLCVLDIPSPSWSERDCPYCKCEIPMYREFPEKLRNRLSINGQFLYRFSDLHIWFMSGLHKSRVSALGRISHIFSNADNHQDVIIFCSKLIMIHGEIVNKWNIINASCNLVSDAIIYADIDNKCQLLKIASKSDTEVRRKFLFTVFTKIINDILDHNVFLELYNSIKSNAGWFDKFDDFVSQSSLPQKYKYRWESLGRSIKNGILSSAVEAFLAITKINRIRAHKTLADEISEYGFNQYDVRIKIDKLKQIISHFPSSPSINLVKNNLLSSCNLSMILSDPDFIDNFNNEFTSKSNLFIEKVCNAVGENNIQSIIKNICRNGKDGICELPLLCLPKVIFLEIITFFKDNREKGKSHVKAAIDNDYLVINVISKKKMDDLSFDNAQKSVAKNHINHFLRPLDGYLGYDRTPEKLFSITISLKVVDHEKI